MTRKLAKVQPQGGLLSQLNDDLDRMMLPFFDLRSALRWPGKFETEFTQWAPSCDVKEKKDKYLIRVDVPGVKAEDIEVSMENGMLTIQGSRKKETKEEGENFLRLERSSGSFYRQIGLPNAVNEDKIDAKYCDGVLEIILPKTKESKGRKITIKKS